MRRINLFLAAIVLGALAGQACAEDATAFTEGREAYDAQQYDKALYLFLKASRTDAKNPEVFLYVGKAHYQLGQLPEAITAWQKTLRLDPGETYAAKMLAALRAEVTDVDTRIALTQRLVAERLFALARTEVERLLSDKALTDDQRGKAVAVKARVTLALGRFQDVLPLVLEIRTKYPKADDLVELELFAARAGLHLDDRAVTAAQKALRAIVAGHKDMPAAVVV